MNRITWAGQSHQAWDWLINDVVINPITGRDIGSKVVIVRNWLGVDEAAKLFEVVKTKVPWEQKPLMMYGKEIPQPRLQCVYGDEDLARDGKTMDYSRAKFPIKEWLPEIKAVKDRVSEQTKVRFDSSLLNCYRDGNDYVDWHPDRGYLGEYNTVAAVSLGESREFGFRTIAEEKIVATTVVNHRDCMLMWGDTQNNYKHSVLKSSGGKKFREHQGTRVSITFRCLYPK